MSNFLAFATVTAAFRQTVQEAVAADVPGAGVTTQRPEAVRAGNRTPEVNIYLFQVTPNVSQRTVDLPTRGPDGQVTQGLRAAFDLHYLLSFYGDDGHLEPQRLMGSVVRTLNEAPILARRAVKRARRDRNYDFLAGSDLDPVHEAVRFTPSALSLEELSKLWSVFFQTPYVLSVAYQAAIVFIDGEAKPKPAKTVRERHIEVAPRPAGSDVTNGG